MKYRHMEEPWKCVKWKKSVRKDCILYGSIYTKCLEEANLWEEIDWLAVARNWGCWERMQSDCWWVQGFLLEVMKISWNWLWWWLKTEQNKRRKNTTYKVSEMEDIFFFVLIKAQLIYNVVSISAVQQSDSVIHIYHSFFFFLHCLGPHPQHMEVPRLGVKSEL